MGSFSSRCCRVPEILKRDGEGIAFAAFLQYLAIAMMTAGIHDLTDSIAANSNSPDSGHTNTKGSPGKSLTGRLKRLDVYGTYRN